MSQGNRQLFDKPKLLPMLFVALMAIYLLRQISGSPGFMSELVLSGNDDGMRLLSIRDFLAGQDWYDMRQYRVLPPDGLSLHWSRLVDAPMALLVAALGFFVAPELAERLLTLVWPMGLFLIFAWVTLFSVRRGFGVSAASISLISLWFIQSYQARYFPIGRLDHHNVQLILMLGAFSMLLTSAWSSAVASGVFVALSMAVGMETLPFMAVVGLVWVWRYFRGSSGSDLTLICFCSALGLTAPMAFVAQTPLEQWGTPLCDQLSLPYLGLSTGALGLGLAVGLLRKRIGSCGARAILLLAVSIVVTLLVLPGLTPCFGGPFSDVPMEVREQVIARIGESAPVSLIFRQAPAMAVVLMSPLVLITLLALAIWLQEGRSGAETAPWGLLVLFLAMGCAGAFLQLRAMIWGHAVMAVGFGAVMAHLINRRWPVPRILKVLLLVLLFAVVFLPQILPIGYRMISSALIDDANTTPAPEVMQIDAACNSGRQLRQLNLLSEGTILVPLNLGTGVLVHTHHSVTAAPYHRDTQAMLNGVLPFIGDEKSLRETAISTGAELVLVCAGQIYETRDSMGSRLAIGQRFDWLEPLPAIEAPLMLFRINLEAS